MELNGKNMWAFILIGIGLLIIAGHIGFGLGTLLSWLVPLALIGLGYYGIKNNRSFFGWLLMIIGLFGIASKFAGFFGIIIAICLIGYGVSMLRKRNHVA